VSIPGRQSFAEHARRRTKGDQAINDRLRAFADSRRSSPNVREMQQMDRQKAALDAQIDQGQQGGGHSPGAHAPEPPPDGNTWIRQAFREAKGGA
jgi:hypothetical protein